MMTRVEATAARGGEHPDETRVPNGEGVLAGSTRGEGLSRAASVRARCFLRREISRRRGSRVSAWRRRPLRILAARVVSILDGRLRAPRRDASAQPRPRRWRSTRVSTSWRLRFLRSSPSGNCGITTASPSLVVLRCVRAGNVPAAWTLRRRLEASARCQSGRSRSTLLLVETHRDESPRASSIFGIDTRVTDTSLADAESSARITTAGFMVGIAAPRRDGGGGGDDPSSFARRPGSSRAR